MRLYSYVVARDFGFAPNPFFGYCTLATCKPIIRRTAEVGDWVVGTGSKNYQREGHLVFAMKVAEAMTYDRYWSDERFQSKRPNLRGSVKQAFGDNIYHHGTGSRKWTQENSHHSCEDGTPNSGNVVHDTATDRVLIGTLFTYWGASGPKIPVRFRNVCAVRGHKCNFSDEFVSSFLAWLESLSQRGYVGDPAEF